MSIRFHVLIPARLAATRLPRKPLLLLGGEPLIVRVLRRALASGAASVHVATDSEAIAEAVMDADPTTEPSPQAVARQPKTFRAAFTQILIADLSMSLDNVLAVAGAAREHPAILVFGLLLSIALMGVAASYIARLLHKYRWIGYIGLAIVLYVALHMMWQGHQDIIRDLGYLPAYNAAMPDFLDIQPKAPAH